MEKPLVSIVVVSYNHAHFLEENLNSIKAQTYPSIQLIVADDASKDNSIEVYENWLEKNNYPAIKNFHTKNTGLTTTLNECFDLIEGKYVKFIAADDYLHPEAIEKCVNKLEELGNDYGMVFTDTWAINNKSEITKDIADYNANQYLTKEELREKLVLGNRMAALTVLMRTEALKKTGKYPTDIIVEDYYRWLTISEHYWIGYIPEKLAYYRLHEQNISKVKENIILEEDLILKMKFDKTGIGKQNIDNYFKLNYFKVKQNKKLITQYHQYPFKDKILSFCFNLNFPFLGYRILNKILKTFT